MEQSKLRKLIKGKILEFLTEQKVLAEAEKEGHGKPTSGLKKEKVGTTHTSKNKSKKTPYSKKVTDEGPDKKTFLTGAEPTPVGNETEKIGDNTKDALNRGKFPGKTDTNYETECMGIELKVKGSSYADINHLYMLAQIRKSLEGRGDFVKKVTIEMGEPNEKKEIKESKEIIEFRKKINKLIKEQLKKKFK